MCDRGVSREKCANSNDRKYRAPEFFSEVLNRWGPNRDEVICD